MRTSYILARIRNKFQYRSLIFWDLTLRRLVISYRRFGTTYRPLLQMPSSPFNDVSVQHISPIFKGQAVQNEFRETSRHSSCTA